MSNTVQACTSSSYRFVRAQKKKHRDCPQKVFEIRAGQRKRYWWTRSSVIWSHFLLPFSVTAKPEFLYFYLSYSRLALRSDVNSGILAKQWYLKYCMSEWINIQIKHTTDLTWEVLVVKCNLKLFCGFIGNAVQFWYCGVQNINNLLNWAVYLLVLLVSDQTM